MNIVGGGLWARGRSRSSATGNGRREVRSSIGGNMTEKTAIWLEGADIQVIRKKDSSEIVFRRDQVERFAKSISTVAEFSTDDIPVPATGTNHVPTVSLIIEPNRVGLKHGYFIE
jgi:hypothetical protein